MPPDEARQKIVDELHNPDGGFAYLHHCIDQQDFAKLLEFTKTYDQNLRKTAMGGLKALKVDSERATQLSNAVTFDLIGMNRASRPGQENAEQAAQYLKELERDVQLFLDLPERE